MNSIRRQLSRNLVLVAALFLGASSAIAAVFTIATLRRSFDEGLRERAEAICSLSEKEHGHFAFDFSPEFLAQYHHTPPAAYFQIWDANGNALVRSPSLENHDLPRASKISEGALYKPCEVPAGAGRALALRFFPEGTNKDDPSDALWLTVAADAHALQRECAWIVWVAVGTAAALSMGIFFLVPRVISRGLASIEKLSGQVEAVNAHTLAKTFSNIEVPIELQPISAALDGLMLRLNESFARERSFGSDLAHELRTPLAELKTQVECALKWPDTRDENHDRQLLEIVEQMESLVGRLLFLTRLDAQQKPGESETIDLTEAVRAAGLKYQSVASVRGVRLTTEIEPIEIFADRLMVNIIINNLLQNAAEYSSPGTEIAVRGRRLSEVYQITFANFGELDEEDVQRIFERFWRKSKSRTDLAKHSGLGLSLVRSAVSALGWGIHCQLGDKSKIVFTVTIPRKSI